MRPSLLGLLAAALVAGCGEPPSDPGGSTERGGWDRNAGSYNGNLGSFTGVTGLHGAPPWGTPGAGTLTNASVFGLQPDLAVSPTCATPTPGVTGVRFLSSTGTAAAAVGPDVELTRAGGATARLAMGEEVVFGGHIFDGYLGQADVAFRIRRVDTLILRSALWYEWPVFSLESCEAAAGPGTWRHHGFVSWAPMVRLPELPGESIEYRTDMVQAVTTVPRAEYHGNASVPPQVASQTGALWFKFAFYGSLPVALHGEPALDLTTDTGATIAAAAFEWHGALALGNASWVTLPIDRDAQQHQFPAFFTKDGTPIAMFAAARGVGGTHAAVRLPPSWGGGPVAALVLSADELANPGSLDAVHGELAAPAGQHPAVRTHLGSGRSPYRAGLYVGNSSNNLRNHYFGQWRANAASMAITGLGTGRIASQAALATALGDAASPIAYAVACESPLNTMAAFETPGNWLPPPAD